MKYKGGSFLFRTEDAEDVAPNVIAWRQRRSAICVPEGKMRA